MNSNCIAKQDASQVGLKQKNLKLVVNNPIYQKIDSKKLTLENQNKFRNFSINPQNKASDKLISKMLKACLTRRQGMHPKRFCRRWFGLEATRENGRPRYEEEEILAIEAEYGYREKCINLIARLLQIKPNTVHRWGKGVEFDKIARDKLVKYELYLGYIDTIRVMITSCAKLDEALLIKLARSLAIDELI